MTKILIVDDVAKVRTALCRFFEVSGLGICYEAASGREALQVAKRVRPDIVILDFSMPGMNGVQTAKALRESSPDVPVFILTAHFDIEKAVETAGTRGVFLKHNVKPLVAAVRSHLAKTAVG